MNLLRGVPRFSSDKFPLITGAGHAPREGQTRSVQYGTSIAAKRQLAFIAFQNGICIRKVSFYFFDRLQSCTPFVKLMFPLTGGKSWLYKNIPPLAGTAERKFEVTSMQ
jgi:hypothetical protein